MSKILVILFLSVLVFSSCTSINQKRVRGDGNVTTQQRTVADFDAIQSHGSFDVYVATGNSASVKIEADENLHTYIETNVEGNTLNIKTRKGFSLKPRKTIKVFVVAPKYTAVQSHGSGNIYGQNTISSDDNLTVGIAGSGNINLKLNAKKATLKIMGSGDMQASGESRVVECTIHGSGDIKAQDLKAHEATVQISGSGNTSVSSDRKLKVNIHGSGDVKYWGNPQAQINIQGSGSAHAMH